MEGKQSILNWSLSTERGPAFNPPLLGKNVFIEDVQEYMIDFSRPGILEEDSYIRHH